MSDHDAAPDPIDKAYVQAEAMLSDDEARAARRARVLAAAAQAAPAAATPKLSFLRRPVWRHGRWLAAASVAGLAVLIAAHIYAPVIRQSQTAPTAASAGPTAAAPAPERQPIAASPGVRPPAALPAPSARPLAAAPSAATPAPTPDAAPPALPPPAPPPPPAAPALQAFPAAPAPPPAMSDVTAERRADDAASAFAARPDAAPPARSELSGGQPSDRGAGLRAAAAAGRTAEVQALLQQGAPVDAPDADGETALMKSIQADQPAAAGLLRRHGASLDRRNHAGQSARDMATAKGDAALDQAVGLGP